MVHRHVWLALIAAGMVTGMSTAGLAADMPAKANAVTVSSGNVYLWLDGSWERMSLPTFDLGWKHMSAGGANLGAAENFDPRVSGAGFSGGLGYKFQRGAFPAMFGDNFRAEVGVSYFSGKSNQSGSSTGPDYSIWGLNGSKQFSVGGGACPCSESSQLETNLNTFQGKIAFKGDHLWGAATLTPSLTLFGGRSQNSQSFSQFFRLAIPSGNYSAQSDLRSNDWGAKIGINADFAVMKSVSIGFGGDIGTANRSVSLSAIDQGDPFFFGIPPLTQISASATTTPLLASGNVHLAVMPTSNVTLRAFGGVNYDSRVPGIATSAIGVSDVAGNGPPAGLRFASEVNYFAGGGVSVKFAP